jgi:hypothetical protein
MQKNMSVKGRIFFRSTLVGSWALKRCHQPFFCSGAAPPVVSTMAAAVEETRGRERGRPVAEAPP